MRVVLLHIVHFQNSKILQISILLLGCFCQYWQKLCICKLCNFLVNYVHFLKCRVLERIGARALVAHVRTFADFLVYEFSTSAGGQQLNKCIEILNDMVWKYNIVTLDRLILCLVSPLLLVFYVHESCYMVDVSD